MKIGLSSYSISRAISAGEMNILDAIRWVAEKGGEHMEVVPGAFQIKDPGDPIIQQIRDTAKECGIALSNYAVSGNFAAGSPEDRKKEVERLKGQVDIAAALGVSLMRHDAAHFGGDARQNSIERAEPQEIFQNADFISLHLPLTPETEGFVGRKELAMMKKDAVLINTARGGLVDEKALLEALKEKQIYGAGLDAFAHEPPEDNDWFALDNVVLGSHCAASTRGATENMGRMATENLLKDLAL